MKRESKSTREARELDQLKLQFRLIYSAAEGGYIDEPDDYFVSAETLSNAIPVIRDIWMLDNEVKTNHCTRPHMLDYWGHPDKAAEWLFGLGVRPIAKTKDLP